MASECSCETCQKCCEWKPGWFKPGEAELAAQHLGITLEEFFRTKLGVDYWVNPDAPPVLVLSPAITRMQPGGMFPYTGTGRCVFFTDDRRCAIHPVKPFECRESDHSTSEVEKAGGAENDLHRQAMLAWANPEAQASVHVLRPEGVDVPEPTIWDMLSHMMV